MYRDRDPYVKGSSVCRICNKRCTECYGKADNCSACGAGFVLKDNKCVAKCRGHQWWDNDKCELCHPSCKTCQGGASSFNCTSCPKIYLNDVEDRYFYFLFVFKLNLSTLNLLYLLTLLVLSSLVPLFLMGEGKNT